MDKKKIFDIFNYKKSSKNTPVVKMNYQDISINITEVNTATLQSDLDHGNWNSGPVASRSNIEGKVKHIILF